MPITNRNTAIVLDTLNKTAAEPTAILFNVISEDNASYVAGGSAVSLGKISGNGPGDGSLAAQTKYDYALTKKQSIYRYFENTVLPFYIEPLVDEIRDGDHTAVTAFTKNQKGKRKYFSPLDHTSRHHVSTQYGLAVTMMPHLNLRSRPVSGGTAATTVSGIISGFMRFKISPNPMSVFCFSAPDTNPVVASSFTSSELADTSTFVDYLGNKDINVSLHATGDQ